MLKFSLVLSSIEISTSLDESPQSGIPRNAFRIQIPLVFVCGFFLPRDRTLELDVCCVRAFMHVIPVGTHSRANLWIRWGPIGAPFGAQLWVH